MHALRYQVYRMFWKTLDWVFPPACAGCERSGERWCESCRAAVQRLGVQICPTCGHLQSRGQLCERCLADPPAYRHARGWGRYEGALKKAIHRLKYRRDVGLGDVLSQHLISLLAELNWPVELVMPVPLSRNRLRERGYNQAALLAYPIALHLGLEYNSATLTRLRDTRSQVNLTEVERKQNVAGAFQVNGLKTHDRVVLLVDDVSTTGSTLQSCTEALVQSGAGAVYCLTLAVADRDYFA